MMRRSMIEVLGGYRQSPSAEDHELWLRAIERFRFGAIPQPLLEYRHHTGGTSRVRAVEQSLSNLMNATCYRIRLQTGVDFQADAPAEYEELRTWASGEFGENLTLIARARQIRSEARRGDKANAIRALVRFPLKHLGFLSQANVRRWMLRAQGRMQRQSIRLLAAKTSRPRGE
jgi:hypothetical protein